MLFNTALDMFCNYLSIVNRSNETISGYKKDLTGLVNFLESRYNCAVFLEDITVLDLEAYLAYLGNRGLSAKSRSRVIYAIRSFWNYASDKRELVSKNIARSIETIKIPFKERTFLREDEVKQLIQSIDNRLIHIITETLYYTGLRVSECLNLKIGDVDLDTEVKVIKVIKGKGGKDRTIPINSRLLSLLSDYYANWRAESGSQYFFTTKRTGRVSAVYVNQILRETAARLGWKKHISAHILRHSMASNMIKKGVDLPTVQKILGHSSLKVTSIYCHTDMSRMESAVQVI